MKLSRLIAGQVATGDLRDVEITGLAYSTRDVEPGSLFFCVPGFKADGHDFGGEAVARGAVALVCERLVDFGGAGRVPQVVVPDARRLMAPVAARFYGDPSVQLTVVGVTGTNGKTTTAHLVRKIFETAGLQCGLLGTVQSIVGGRVEDVERTTPEAPDLQRAMRRMLDAGDRACAMEVSSHATRLHRADAIEFDRAIFTNLTPEHLDFHGDMEDYYESKRIVFFPESGGPAPSLAVVNIDDEFGRRLASELVEAGRDVDTFSIERPACYRAFDVRLGAESARFKVADLRGDPYEIAIPLVGRFNVFNALAAIAVARSLDIELETIRGALRRAEQVPGRFERIDAGQDFAVIVDYAHTPDSLANVLQTARAITAGDRRLHVVFGCGGDRDRAKRPQMGRIATELADGVVVTSDNPRNEEPQAIIDEILGGVEGPGGSPAASLEVEVDRRRAIELALHAADAGDTVVIAGKGHEQGQEFKQGEKIPFDDGEVARQALEALAAASG